MATEITAFSEEMVDAVKAFNQRLKFGGTTYQFPERHAVALPRVNGRKIFQEYFLAVENGKDVRGAFIMQHQQFSSWGKDITVAHYDLPISEGFVNKSYGLIGVQLVMNALKRQPHLFSLGLGGHEEPLAQMLKKLGWTISEVPFHFKVCHPANFLRNIQVLRKTSARRAALDLLAITGLGWAGIKTAHLFLGRKRARVPLGVRRVNQFDRWSDALWDSCKNEYALCGIRDSETLNVLYSSQKRDFIRLKITDGEKILGWAVLLDTQMTGSPQFGNLRVGSIVDCLASRAHAPFVIRAASDWLEEAGVDLLISNQLDCAWCSALREDGFLSGPSNYLFAASKKLLEVLQPFDQNRTRIHLTRGDGGGPMNL